MRIIAIFAAIGIAIGCSPGALSAPSYSVTNVKPGDVLNLRNSPGPQSSIMAVIPFDGTGIVTTGRTAPNSWVEVDYQSRRGWVNGRYLAFGRVGTPQLPANLICAGTEPFWAITLTPGWANADLNFASRRQSYRVDFAKPALGRSHIWHLAGAARTSGSLPPRVMSLIVQRQSCSDGMSDLTFPFSVVALLTGEEMITGCCRPAR